MENLTVSSSTAGVATVSFSVPEDRSLVAVTPAAQVVLTGDPSATYTTVVTTPTTGVDRVTLGIFAQAGFSISGLKIPIEGGRTYYVLFKAAGAVTFLLDDVLS